MYSGHNIVDREMWGDNASLEIWYAGQTHYRTKEERQADVNIEEETLSFPQTAASLGISRNKVNSILRDNRYRHYFEFIAVADKQRVTKESFAEFVAGQDQYGLCSESDDRPLGNGDRRNVAVIPRLNRQGWQKGVSKKYAFQSSLFADKQVDQSRVSIIG